MFDAIGQSQTPICPRCRRPGSLRLRARLQEADRFPEIQCLECWACSEVVILDRGLSRRIEAGQEIAVRLAA
jgi:hypothetical protein